MFNETEINYLISKYSRKLISLAMASNGFRPIGLLNANDFDCQSDYSKYSELFKAYCNLLAQLGKPIYKSRQDFLKSLFVTPGREHEYHRETIDNSSTCMGGHSDEDPFYDPNWKMVSYESEGKIYSKITDNLKVRFFHGSKCGWQYFDNKPDYIFSLSMEDVSIEEFNAIFDASQFIDSPDDMASFEARLTELLQRILVIEDFEASDFCLKMQEKQSNPESESEIKTLEIYREKAVNRENMIHVDELGNALPNYWMNARLRSPMKVGDLIVIDHAFRKVTNMQFKDDGLGGSYMVITSKAHPQPSNTVLLY